MSQGYLILNTTSAQKIIPVPNTTITIAQKGQENKVFMSDESGKTPLTTISTPEIALSEAPSPEEVPFSSVDVTAEKEGFFTTVVNGVQIFPERTTTLYVNMVPIPEFGENTPLTVETLPQNL